MERAGVSAAAELVEAAQARVPAIEVDGVAGGMPMITLDRGVRLRDGVLLLARDAVRYGPAGPLPEGSNRAAVYNGVLPRLRALTDRMGAVGVDRGASAADVAVAWAIAKGTTRSSGSRRRVASTGWSALSASSSPTRRSARRSMTSSTAQAVLMARGSLTSAS